MPVSVKEYLDTTYRPDCDYVDGEVLERNPGELSHGRLQILIGVWMVSREAKWRIKAVTEVRLKVGPRRYRIPDVTVLSLDAPCETVIVTPPLLCIEVLSPSDTLNQLWDRIQDYFSMGVPACWTIDPQSRRGWIATAAGLAEAKDGLLRAGEIEMPLSEVLE